MGTIIKLMKTSFIIVELLSNSLKLRRTYHNKNGFTIVELLVVIVVIAILAAISLVSYTGISNKAVVSSLQTDLSNNSKKLKMYQADYGSYPTQLDANYCPLLPVADITKYCIKFSNGNNYIGYSGINSSSTQTFLLVAGNGTNNYQVTNTTSPTISATTMQPGVTPGAVLELRASKANGGSSLGINSPLTTTWTDTSGNNNNGTLTNFGTQTPWGGVGTVGDPYKLTFDLINDIVIIPSSSTLQFGNSDFSIEAWFIGTTGSADHRYMVVKGASSGLKGFRFGFYSNGKPHALIGDQTTYDDMDVSSSVVVNDGLLHHMVMVFKRLTATVTCWVDNSQVGTGSMTHTNPNSSIDDASDSLLIGGVYGTTSTSITRIYPFALTTSQMQSNYIAGPN